ncbi:MAG: hypothetical protein CW335_06440, partial [Clostridiales bacterium]|nr:hypothetical protein [Clostridiales bacterium]
AQIILSRKTVTVETEIEIVKYVIVKKNLKCAALLSSPAKGRGTAKRWRGFVSVNFKSFSNSQN